MRTRQILKPGQRGTRRLLAEYGERLLCVRYREDRQRKKRYKTVELIVEQVDWEPPELPFKAETIVGVRVAWGEKELANLVKRAGGKWNRDLRVWELRYDSALAIGIEDRIVKHEVSTDRGSQKSLQIETSH